MRTAITGLALAAILSVGVATRASGQGSGADIENQREWLSARLTERLTSANEILNVTRRLDRMSDQQIRQLVSIYRQKQQGASPQRLAAAQADFIRAQQLQDRLLQERQRRLVAQQRQVDNFGRNQFGPNNFGLNGVGPQFGGYPAGGYYYPGRVVGYQPNITWLPTGATLTARGTVSPDGRHVRTSVQPFFSSVRAVHSYNLQTGETKRIR